MLPGLIVTSGSGTKKIPMKMLTADHIIEHMVFNFMIQSTGSPRVNFRWWS